MGETVVVQTSYGPVRGIKRTSYVNEEFVSFRGIPYAKPPVGALRFKDPQPPVPWVLPKDATRSGHTAMALAKFVNFDGKDLSIEPSADEDCLLLNVFTKELKPAKPLPVMVFIHGGAFKTGSADEKLFSPDYLLRHNIVFVSINYRLGALGFLSISDPSVAVPGNAGLKDQSLALRWVRQNIANFGGDAANVTIFGESAGGASVHFHMLSELSRGLFDKAIAQSGAAECPWAWYPNNNWPARLAKKLGWTGEGGSRGAYDFLKEADAADIVRAQDDLTDQNEKLHGVNTFGPVNEPYRGQQTFFCNDFEKLKRNSWSVNVPLLIGGNANEGLLFWQLFQQAVPFLQSPTGVISLLTPAVLQAKGPEVQQRVLDYYYPEGPNAEDVLPLTTMWGDRYFWQGIYAAIEARLKAAGTAPTYLYRFAKDSRTLNHLKLMMMGIDHPGVCHADELLYLFRPHVVDNVQEGSLEQLTIDRMTDVWTHFAATGNPTTAKAVKDVNWQAVNGENGNKFEALNVNDELTVGVQAEAERVVFWDDVFAL